MPFCFCHRKTIATFDITPMRLVLSEKTKIILTLAFFAFRIPLHHMKYVGEKQVMSVKKF
ncbi:MAG TPA: hypothetical protein DEA89_04555 [Candidatus Moranbacteria bacterium]|nr:hypothetical protein [Candidatus Moranbacteria bacterium]HCO99642.1 hypothetical protein [Candidatus Moranbacteria bacterium]